MASNLFNGTDLMGEWCELFGIEGMHIRSMTIKIDIDDVVRIEVTHFMDTEQREKLMRSMRHYKLTPIEDGTDKKKQ